MKEMESLVFRDNAKAELMKIKTVETGVEYLNKVKAIEVWARAEKKDAELQNMIAEQKIRTQRILGQLITDGQNNGELKTQATAKSSTIKELDDVGITKKESSAFKAIASIPEREFEDFIEEKKQAVDMAVSELTTAGVLRLAKGAHVSNNSGENEWYTPPEYIESAKVVMGGIDLDPASSKKANEIIGAKTFFDEKKNGLAQKWFGKIWMNPPYAQPFINDFISKLETESYEEAIVLVNNATETKWGQKLLELCSAICFHSSRIRFLNPEGEYGEAPLQGQMIVYLGEGVKEFIKEFSQYGICLKKEL